jgi:uncharacterized delta-60 repeat protein
MWFHGYLSARLKGKPCKQSRTHFTSRKVALALSVENLENRTLLSGTGLDPAFGTGGEVVTSFNRPAFATKVLVQPDQKIVAVGTSSVGFTLARYNTDGTLDATFGVGGKVTGPLGTATGATMDGNGNIIAAGENLATQFVVARFTAGGVLDNSFGAGGVITTAIPYPFAASVAVQPTDGKIVLAGYSAPPHDNSIPPPTMELIRYNADGSLDTNFGSGGIANLGSGKISSNYPENTSTQIAIQKDGKIVFAGDAYTTSATRANFFVKRVNPNGSVDATFPSFVNVGIGSNSAVALTLQSDGKFLELGNLQVVGNFQGELALVRLNTDGTLDASFGVNGKVATGGGNKDSVQSNSRIAVQGNGQIIVAGAEGNAFKIVRYNVDGSVDTRFGAAGVVLADFATPVSVGDVAVQADGKIVVAGGGDIDDVGRPGEFAPSRFVGGASGPLSGTPNQRFVQQVYLDVLDRPAEPNGLAKWSTLLDQGKLSRTEVASSIEASTECHALVVKDLYAQYFHRGVDTGAQQWIGFLDGGATKEQLAARLAGSAE